MVDANRIACPSCDAPVQLTPKGLIRKHNLAAGQMCRASYDHPNQWRKSDSPELRAAYTTWMAAVKKLNDALAAARSPEEDFADETVYRSTPEVNEASKECSQTYAVMADIRERLGLCRCPMDSKERV